MKIVHIYSHEWGGAWVRTQARNLAGRGHELTIICPAEGPFSEACRRDGLNVVICPFHGSRLTDIPRILRSLWLLRQQLRSLAPDVVHSHLLKATMIGRLAGWLAGVPVRASQMGGPLSLETPFFRILNLGTSYFDTQIICPSIGVMDIYNKSRAAEHKTKLLYCAFDQERFIAERSADTKAAGRAALGLSDASHVVAMVAYMYGSTHGRFRNVGIKGHETLIECAGRVLSLFPNARFLIVGEDPDGTRKNFDRLLEMARDMGVEQAFVFTGHREDIADLISLADVAVVPSLSENCGGAVEPFAAGVPVVASNTGGLPELVIPGLTGFRSTPADSASLADQIIAALSLSERERVHLGRNGRILVSELFDPRKCATVLESLYRGESLKGQLESYQEAVGGLVPL